MMKLETNERTYDVNYILPRGDVLTISLESGEPISVIAGDIESMSMIVATENDNPNVTHTYEGYTMLDDGAGIQRMSSGRVRVTLVKK